MEVISKIILGIVQGITEIIPVSSSGHLILFSRILDFEIDLAFLTFLHLMTGLAIICGFWQEIKKIFISKKRNHILKILTLGFLPAAFFGIIVFTYVEDALHRPIIIIPSLIFFGIVMIFIDSIYSSKTSINKIEDIKQKNALIIGVSQILSLIPGTSRSGITIISAVTSGINKKTAVAFSFLIGLPLIIGSFIFECIKNKNYAQIVFDEENLIGGISAFVFAYLTILIFKKLLHTKFLTFFGLYRILLGILMAIVFVI